MTMRFIVCGALFPLLVSCVAANVTDEDKLNIHSLDQERRVMERPLNQRSLEHYDNDD